jgi:hypothetical protein
MSTQNNTPGGEVVVYELADGSVRVDVRLEQDTVWLTQRQMSELFETTPENVLMHLKNIFGDGELDEAATAKEFLVVQTEGNRQVRRNLKHYNLDAVISVGYRVNSRRGVRFRQWATRVLRDHLVQGYTFNQSRLAERVAGGPTDAGPAGPHSAKPGTGRRYRPGGAGVDHRLCRYLAPAAGI